MPPKQSHGQHRRAMFKWEAEHRVALHLMHTEFHLSQETIEAVFRHMYRDHIRACGVSSLTAGALRMQYRERGYASRSHLWAVTFHPPKTARESALRREIRDRIADAVRAIGSTSGEEESEPRSQDLTSIPKSTPKKHIGAKLKVEAIVEIPVPYRITPASPRLLMPPTPPETPRASKTILYDRPDGSTVNISVAKWKKQKPVDEFVQPSTDAIYPLVLPPIMYRFWWPGQLHCGNSKDGFVAGKYYRKNAVPKSLPSSRIDATDALNHVEAAKVPSQWISVSSSLRWILTRAMNELKSGRKGIQISIISSKLLPVESIFYARPLIESLRKMYALSKAEKYWGSNEFWIWARIPKAAMLTTIPLSDIVTLTNQSPGVSKILQLSLLQNSCYKILQPSLKASKIDMEPKVAISLATVTQRFGLDTTSSADHIAAMLSNFITGWEIKIKSLSPSTIEHCASWWSHTFIVQSKTPCQPTDLLKLKIAFYEGCCLGLRNTNFTDWNQQNSPGELQKILRKSKAVGLNPSSLEDDLFAMKQELTQYCKRHDQVFETRPSQLLLEEPADDDSEDQEMSDNISSFEFDEDGIVL